jgi:hypothetical protein
MSSEIPEKAAEIFDEKLLLDQIFGSSMELPPAPLSPAFTRVSALPAEYKPERRRPWYGELFKEALLSKESKYWLAFILIVMAMLAINNSLVGKQNNGPKHHNWLTIQRGSWPLVPDTTGVIRVDYQQ